MSEQKLNINLKRNILFSAMLFLGFILSGCAVSPAIVMVSPQYEKAQIHRIALVGFQDYPEMEGSGEIMSGIFEKYLFLGGYQLVERRQVSEIMKEQAFQLSGGMNQGELKKIGELLNVDALVIGNINDIKNPSEQTVMVNIPQSQSSPIYGQIETVQKTSNSMVKTTQNYVAGYNYTWHNQIVPETERTPAHIGISVRMVDIETGELLWSASVSSEGAYLNDASEKASSKIMQTIIKQLHQLPQK